MGVLWLGWRAGIYGGGGIVFSVGVKSIILVYVFSIYLFSFWRGLSVVWLGFCLVFFRMFSRY